MSRYSTIGVFFFCLFNRVQSNYSRGYLNVTTKYTKIEPYAETIFRRKGDDETYREIEGSLELSKEQMKGFVKRRH